MSEWNCNICQYEEIRENLPATWTARFGNKPDWLCAYIQDKTHLAGLCLFSIDKDDKVLNVHFIFVLMGDRRKGVASLLMRHIFKEYNTEMKCRIYYERFETSDVQHEFLCSLGFKCEELNASIYYVNRTGWVQNVLPRINLWARKAIDCTYINWQDMDMSLRKTWQDICADGTVPDGLNPGYYSQSKYKKIFFHTSEGKPLGWVVVSLKLNDIVSLDVIYILPALRGGSTVFSMYEQTTDFVFHTWPETTGLYFQLDTQDEQLCCFYNRLLRNTAYTCMKKYKYELSLLQTT